MKKLALLFLSIFIFGCSSSKNVAYSSKGKSNKQILPPDVPSNKYSKTRQGG